MARQTVRQIPSIHFRTLVTMLAGIGLFFESHPVPAQFPQPVPDTTDARSRERTPLAPLPKSIEKLVANAQPLNPQRTVFLDRRGNSVFLHTEVSCRNCVLEMLCVPIGQREHETILRLRSRAYIVHAALLALKLEPGKTAVFYPDFRPPSGPPLDLYVHWVDADGKHQREDARSWIRHSINRYFSKPLAAAPPGVKLPHEELRYDPYNKELLWYGPMTMAQRTHLLALWDDKAYQAAIGEFYKLSQSRPMTAEFVFTGSRWNVNEETGTRHYAAEGGHFITVANFPSSMIDIAEASSASDGGQTYEAWQEKIPPAGAPVLLEIKPAAKKKAEPRANSPTDSPSSSAPDSPATESS